MLGITTLMCWLATEALGAFMARGWIRRRGARSGNDGMPPGMLIGHAGLNAAGLLCWIVFVAAGAKPLAWAALALMAPAIGLGISTVAIWTPYPGRAEGEPEQPVRRPAVVPDRAVQLALEDEAATTRLVDELIARNAAPPPPRPPGWHLRPLVPAGHGVLAIATFSLALLSAVAAG